MAPFHAVTAALCPPVSKSMSLGSRLTKLRAIVAPLSGADLR
jgi:hypothetical protein